MKNIYSLSVIIILASSLMIFAQVRDLSQKPTDFHNPYFTYSNVLDTSYNVLSESFEALNFPAHGWTKASRDGGTGWQRAKVGTTPLPGWQGGTIFVPDTSFGNAVAYCTWSTGGPLSNDQWLITPKISNVQPQDSISFWLWKYGGYNDSLNVMISLTSPIPDSMKITAAAYSLPAEDSGWVQYKINFGSLVPKGSAIYLSFQEYVPINLLDGDFLALDMVNITSPIPTSINSHGSANPSNFELLQNYPNPFNPNTVISYSLPSASNVKLTIYNTMGQSVKTLENRFKNAGSYSVNFNASSLPSGIYFYKLDAGQFTQVKKMILIK